MDKQELARESFELHSKIAELRERLLAINAELAKFAEFPDGKNTAHFSAEGYKRQSHTLRTLEVGPEETERSPQHPR